MPKRASELTPAQIRGLKHPGGDRPVKVAVGGVSGLYIQITPSEAKSWVLRARFGAWQEIRLPNGTKQRGRAKREIGLGPYPDVLPGPARDKAREMKAKLEQGVDPIAERKAAKEAQQAAIRKQARTFAVVFEEWAAIKTPEFATEKFGRQWRAAVETYAFPVIGDRPIDSITTDDVLEVLRPIWIDKTETALKLRQKIEGTFRYAAGELKGNNPARWEYMKDRLSDPKKVSGAENYPAVKVDDLQRWWKLLQTRSGMGADALRFQAMTATRVGAVRLATWDEFNFERGLWTIQPNRESSKITDGRARRVPLTPDMIALLQSLPRLDGCPYLFWSGNGTGISDAIVGKVMRTIHEADLKAGGAGFVDEETGKAAVPHGLRSTFKVWVRERTDFDTDLAELALFHKLGGKVQQAYDRGDAIEKRRAMMAAWNAYLTGKTLAEVK